MQKTKISVVIICKNAVKTIGNAIQSVISLTDDIVIVDSGSTDETLDVISSLPAKLFQTEWKGYGATKNFGNEKAVYDWVLSIDADEMVDATLLKSLYKADLNNSTVLYKMKRLNYLGKKPVHFGEWGHDVVIRLFNKQNIRWDDSAAHEELIVKFPVKYFKLKGYIHHYTADDIEEYKNKLYHYAFLMAEKYMAEGKAFRYKMYFSPFFNFIHNYILKAGFLDGKKGLQIALAHSKYNFEKYRLLKNNNKKSLPDQY